MSPRVTLGLGSAPLAALALLLAGAPVWLGVALAGSALAVGAGALGARAHALLRRHPELWLVVVLAAGGVAWAGLALLRVDSFSDPPGSAFAPPSPATDWPWELGHLALLPLVAALLTAAGGLVLIADAVRVRLGFAPHQPVPWRDLTAVPERPVDITSRVVTGVLLVIASAALAIILAGPFTAGDHTREVIVLVAVGAVGAMLVGIPALIGSRMRLDRDKAVSERELERRRLAAHLHDSVLQTLALVQRQAHDPATVARLARRQEHALRAWMAGHTELFGDTLVSALRDAVAEVEDESSLAVELTAIGDCEMTRAGEALVAAAREALRNAARHAAGAPVFLFAEVSAAAAEVFVRDEGPGFDLEAVPAERRGIADAICGRMAAVGGRATVESAPGLGTEVALRIGGAR